MCARAFVTQARSFKNKNQQADSMTHNRQIIRPRADEVALAAPLSDAYRLP
jgi:hypothetical protein